MPKSLSSISAADSLSAASTLENSIFRPMRDTTDSTFTDEWLWNDDQTKDERNWELVRILLYHKDKMRVTSQHGQFYRGRFNRPDNPNGHYLIFFELNHPGYEKVTYCFKSLSMTNDAIREDMEEERFERFKPLFKSYFEFYDAEWPEIELNINNIGASLWW